jgi:hypothetical protein
MVLFCYGGALLYSQRPVTGRVYRSEFGCQYITSWRSCLDVRDGCTCTWESRVFATEDVEPAIKLACDARTVCGKSCMYPDNSGAYTREQAGCSVVQTSSGWSTNNETRVQGPDASSLRRA